MTNPATDPTAASPFMTPRPDLAPGTHHNGFTVTGIETLPELPGCAYIMRHDASGARLMWLACADTNRSFAIGFKTPPADDTGVFHILEHSVLCGSGRFPVKEPFVNLLKTSMQTFLNAMTFPDKTVYPVASTNVADLENLMDVYLDAVFDPDIYRRPRIFEQEGWHYETRGQGDDLSLVYNGVVFNEMKGALSDPDEILFLGVCRQLFPDTPYRFESGGHPRAIPTLTYEKFIDTHSRHYSLPNSYTVLYGDLDIERELAFIERRFAAVPDRGAGAPNPLPAQAPVTPDLKRVEMATAPENATVALAYVVGEKPSRERLLATGVLLDALCGSNEAPLKRVILDAGLADDFSAHLIDAELQPFVFFQLKGAKPDVAGPFRDLLEKTCAKLAKEGVPRVNLEASLARTEFNLRENDFGSYPDGIMLSITSLSSWLYDDDMPCDYLRYEDELASLQKGLAGDLFERLLQELVVDSAHSAEVELVPVEEGDATAEADELASALKGMSAADVEKIDAEVEALRLMQESPDDPADLAKLPRLALEDIGPDAPEPPAPVVEAPLPCIAHELETHGIAYAYHYFDLGCVTFEELPYVAILTELLGKLDTAHHTASELDTLVEGNLGALSFTIETYSKDDEPLDAHPKLLVGASALSEKIASLASIPAEVWGTTSFADHARILAILQQRRISLEQHFTNAGHSAAMARLGSYFLAGSVAAQAMGGVDYYLFLKDLLANFDERADDLAAKLAELSARIFTADDVIVSFVGTAADRERFWEKGQTLGLERTASGEKRDRALKIPAPVVKNEAFALPADVCFVCEGQAPTPTDTGTPGAWAVASRALTFDYLWGEVRVKGGAYGTGFRHTDAKTTCFWSFRDPAVDPSVERYERAAAWLENWEPTEDELTGYIVSVVATHDAPVKPRRLARRQDMARFGGKPEDWRQQVREQELSVTADELRSLAPTLAELPGRRAFCVFGAREKIEASKLDLTIIDLMGSGE